MFCGTKLTIGSSGVRGVKPWRNRVSAALIGIFLLAAPAVADEILVSRNPDRSLPSLLNGSSVFGEAFIFFTTGTVESQIDNVEFFIDGTQITKDNKSPYDVAGGTTAAANPYDTLKKLTDGPHTMEAVLTLKDSTTRRTAAAFVVANAFAPITLGGDLKVISAVADVDAGNLVLSGVNFDRRAGVAPRVSLDLLPIQVTGSTAQWLIATLPAGLSDGDHTINVSSDGVLVPGLNDRDHSELFLTVGAVGPAGIQGPAGAAGPQGPPGTGDITSVLAGPGLSGGATSGDVALSLNTLFTDERYAAAVHGHDVAQVTNAATRGSNTFSGNQTINGSIAVNSTAFSGVSSTVGGAGAIAIRGTSTATSTTGFGVTGVTSATQGASAGVYGRAEASSGAGSVHGVYGETIGTVGAAVRGLARQGLGVEGISEGVDGMAMLAQIPSTTGSGTAILATVNSGTATPGVFQNNGGGNLIIGKVSNVEKFRVNGAGTVFATSYRDQDGNPIGGGDVTAVAAGTGLTGGGDAGDISLGLNLIFTDSRYAPTLHGHTVSQITNAATLGANTFTATQTIDGGNLDLDSSTATTGNITKNGSPFLHNMGVQNTFAGQNAGSNASPGADNAGFGWGTLQNSTGNGNTAVGVEALHGNTQGFRNTAVGIASMTVNTTGAFNAAMGDGSLARNTMGHRNTALGANALANTTTGSDNVAIGASAGANATTGSNNIYLGDSVLGVAGESNAIYLGLQGQHTKAFIAGIRGITTLNANAVPVMIDSAGQLGTISSSRSFKEDIHDMADASERLLLLRPVTFRYTQAYRDGSKPIQYGLIAEEVAEIFPELAVRNADGQVETVHYETLNVLLLNELQKKNREIEAMQKRIEAIERRMER